MNTTQAPMYLCLFFAEDLVLCDTKEEMLEQVRMHCDQRISDFYRDRLPVKFSKEHDHWFDVRVWALTDETEVTLDFQEILDEYYEDMKTWEAKDTLRAYGRFVELSLRFRNTTVEQLTAWRKEAGLPVNEEILKDAKKLGLI